ncbi:hypothetical protein CP533_6316 [Ophiocordyceps camponoti-saundersi (nom. inval.)]|nr:hypothetical protein CP533_6316 [Ophiocordyceps camponoti-saundersi (nom. inval.)]
MADDSDSDCSSSSYTETSVLLGYASRSDEADDVINKLGGQPDWMEGSKPPSATLARCGVCKDLMPLLLQINGELPDRFPGHERRLYVFACRKKSCRRGHGCVRVVRAVRDWGVEEVEKVAEEKKIGLGDALFGTSSMTKMDSRTNPFVVSSDAKAVQPVQPSLSKTFAQSLSLHETTSPHPPKSESTEDEEWPSSPSKLPTAYPRCYLSDADYETLEPASSTTKIPPQARLVDATDELPSALDREAFESTMDATFQKFADRIAQNPDQVLRYHFAGQPLLYSDSDAVGRRLVANATTNVAAASGGVEKVAVVATTGFPACSRCAGPRCFELQLTPNAIVELEAGDLGFEGMEWGTIIVAVCAKDCLPHPSAQGEVYYLEEWAGVQWEELISRK